MSCKKPVHALDITEFPVDTLEALPDYILGERDVIDPKTEESVPTLERIPSAKLFPAGNMANIFPLDDNSAITISENQVLAGRISAVGNTYTTELADATHKAEFLIIGRQADQILAQATGIISIPNGHDYVIGAQYYTGANGEPVTDSASGDKLFIPVTNTKLLITRNW